MKSRIITGVVGGGLLLAILLLCPDICLNIAFVLVCALAMYEVLIVTRFVEHKGLMAAAVAFSMLTPFFLETTSRYPAFIVILLFVLGLAFVQVLYHETLRVERTGFVFFVSIIVPIALSCTPYLQTLSRVHGRFYVFLAFIIPWMCDIGAYFVGTFLGKHKMCPKISPKKTVEGLVGGIVISVAASVLAAWLYQVLHLTPNQLGTVSLWQVGLLALVLPPLSVMGDLFASIIKRQSQVKDFGHIMPGHGGIMDRFDSMIFVSPVLFVVLRFLPLIY